MKHFTNPILKRSFYYAFTCLLFLTACSKTDDSVTDISYLRVINTSPTLATYNIYLNGSRVNSAAIPFAGAVSYLSGVAGNYTLKFTTGSSIETLYTTTAALSLNNFHSFYLTGRASELNSLLITDDLSIPSTDKAYIRFVNLSPDASALDLTKTGSTSLFTNKAYKTASSFVAVDPGSISFDAKETSSGLVKTTSESYTFVAGYHYDIICGGLVTPANDTERPLSIQILKIL